jgi:hypothetical protein
VSQSGTKQGRGCTRNLQFVLSKGEASDNIPQILCGVAMVTVLRPLSSATTIFWKVSPASFVMQLLFGESCGN